MLQAAVDTRGIEAALGLRMGGRRARLASVVEQLVT